MRGPIGAQLQRISVNTAVESGWRTLLVLIINIPTIFIHGWRTPPLWEREVFFTFQAVGLGAYALWWLHTLFRTFPKGPRRDEFIRITRPEQICTLLGLALCWWGTALEVMVAMLMLVHVVRSYLRLVRSPIPSGLVFVGSFIVLIMVGTGALMLPSATPEDRPISLLDAAFTITSAISQTGLVVRPTGEGFTRFGQVIILIWIQVGALGVVVFGALLATLLGASFGLRATQTIAEGTEQGWAGQLSLQRLVTFIIIFTHLVEAVGAVFFYFGWPESWPGMPADMTSAADRWFHAAFFSVSSFCNAGFCTTADSMQSLRAHWTPHLVIVPLIILGSIGFPVLDNLRRVAVARLRGQNVENGALIRLTLNSKIILTTTAIAYIMGFALIFIGEALQTDEPLRLVLLDAHFMNINRTSGFDTIPPAEMGLLSRLALIFLMFLGGSPGSVAGGIKMMVFAVLALTVWATIRGRSETTAFGRTLPDDLVRKCAALIVLALAVCMVTTGVLALTEVGAGGGPVSLDILLFEAVSAFGTTGLSMGITPDLSAPGKMAIMFAMFVGRVGIFAVLAALLSVAARKRTHVAYPREEVVVY